jgi:hypothetical protein
MFSDKSISGSHSRVSGIEGASFFTIAPRSRLCGNGGGLVALLDDAGSGLVDFEIHFDQLADRGAVAQEVRPLYHRIAGSEGSLGQALGEVQHRGDNSKNGAGSLRSPMASMSASDSSATAAAGIGGGSNAFRAVSW